MSLAREPKDKMRIHVLRCDDEPFRALQNGKLVELRKNDRDFRRGDYLVLRRQMRSDNPEPYLTGEIEVMLVRHVQEGYGLQEGYVALSVSNAPDRFETVTSAAFAEVTRHG